MNKMIHIGTGSVELSLNKPVARYRGNPILTSHDVNRTWLSPENRVVTVHNAGIAEYEGKVVMLFRSHLRNGISVIGKAESDDGISSWRIAPVPAMKPCTLQDEFASGTDPLKLVENEAGGVEDPRITRFGDTYYITYSAYHGTVADRVRVSLATTRDFETFTRHGPLLDRDMRNVVIFPEKIGGYFYALMRPNDTSAGNQVGGVFREIRLARNKDMIGEAWTLLEQPVMKQSGGPGPFSHKIGPGTPPLASTYGWLSIFHGVRSTMDGNPYALGVAFHGKEDPSSVQVCSIPVLMPSRADCRVGEEDYVHVPNVVFSCGALRRADGTIVIYYGGNDTVMNVAFSHEDILFELTKRFPQDPVSGIPKHKLTP